VQGGLCVGHRAGLLRGGDSGPAVVPNQAEKSLLSRHLDYLTVEFMNYYNTKKIQMEREHLPLIREEPGEMATISIDLIDVRKYVGGLIKSFDRKAA